MEQEGLFKTAAFGGFDRKSVLAYIDELTEQHNAYEEEMRTKFQEFSKAQDSQVAYIQKLEHDLEEQQSKMEALANQLETERAATPHAASEINDLTQKNSQLEKRVADMEREMNIQLERNRQLQFKMEAVSFKSQKYDEMSTQIGDAMIVAKSNADKMVAEAEEKSSQMLEQAQAQVNELMEQTLKNVRDMEERSAEKAQALEQQARENAEQIEEHARIQAARTVEQAEAQAADTMARIHTQLSRFSGEAGSFKTDTARLRKSIEEILFVLNDRVDVMQEVVRHMENHCEELSTEFHVTEALPEHQETAEQPLVEEAADEAGLFGKVIPDQQTEEEQSSQD